MKKTILLVAVVAAIAIAYFWGAYKNDYINPAKPDDTTIVADGGEDNPSADVPADGGTDEKPQKDEPADVPVEKPGAKSAQIIYNGRVDMNFIEVSFEDGGYGIMQLSEELKNSFDSLEIAEGEKLNVVYTEKDGQKTITEIKQ